MRLALPRPESLHCVSPHLLLRANLGEGDNSALTVSNQISQSTGAMHQPRKGDWVGHKSSHSYLTARFMFNGCLLSNGGGLWGSWEAFLPASRPPLLRKWTENDHSQASCWVAVDAHNISKASPENNSNEGSVSLQGSYCPFKGHR
jgi:hypothetical protein